VRARFLRGIAWTAFGYLPGTVTTTAKPDTFTVQVLNSSGTVLATVGSFSNLNAASGYSQKTADLSAYAGQTITLKFTGSETDTSGGTTNSVIDDTAVTTS